MNCFVYSDVRLEQITAPACAFPFDCGDADLNDYFCNDSANYRKELLTASYQVVRANAAWEQPVALVDLCNDAVRKEELSGNARRKIHHLKRGFRAYPAVKITRLGVKKSLQGKGLGSLTLDLVKRFLVARQPFGCRFLTLDAYSGRVDFYRRNHFRELQVKEERSFQETVPMFFDLKELFPEE